jgi:hypothetical protein
MILAYIDPNSGSILLQVIAAGAMGSVLYFRNAVWYCIRRLMFWKAKNEPLDDSES